MKISFAIELISCLLFLRCWWSGSGWPASNFVPLQSLWEHRISTRASLPRLKHICEDCASTVWQEFFMDQNFHRLAFAVMLLKNVSGLTIPTHTTHVVSCSYDCKHVFCWSDGTWIPHLFCKIVKSCLDSWHSGLISRRQLTLPTCSSTPHWLKLWRMAVLP